MLYASYGHDPYTYKNQGHVDLKLQKIEWMDERMNRRYQLHYLPAKAIVNKMKLVP